MVVTNPDPNAIGKMMALVEESGKTQSQPKVKRVMINPRQLEPKYKGWKSPSFAGGKLYFPVIGRMCRISFRRASEAETYAKRVHARWVRLYDAAVLAMVAE